MSQPLPPSLARCYGMARVARVWKISRASVYRSLKETPPNTIGRPGPVGACSDAELAEHIRQHIAASRLHGSNIEIPIVFITGYGDIPMTVQAMRAGAVEFLTKP